MIYLWHQFIRLLSCIYAVLIIAIIVYGTDIILYFDQTFHISLMICVTFLVSSYFLAAALPPYINDPLSILCTLHVSSSDRSKFLQNDISISSRLYRLVHKIKKQWNIEEEKFIITAAILIILMIIGLIPLLSGFVTDI